MNGLFSTKVLLTQKNSVWGILKYPNKANEFPHILSWDSEELKDEFINRELFPDLRAIDPNFNFKELMRREDFPSKPRALSTSAKASFKMDHIDNQFMVGDQLIKQDKQTILNKDFAVILETDPEGNETWSYWAVSVSQTTPKVYNIDADLDVFFTYSIKEMFNDNPVQIKRAHYRRFEDDGTPNIFNNINSYSEEFDTNFDSIHIFDKQLWQSPNYRYVQIPPTKREYESSSQIITGYNPGSSTDPITFQWLKVNFHFAYIQAVGNRHSFLGYPYFIIWTDQIENNVPYSYLESVIFDEFAVNGVFITPFHLPTFASSTSSWLKINSSIAVENSSGDLIEASIIFPQLRSNKTIEVLENLEGNLSNFYVVNNLIDRQDVNRIKDINLEYDWRLIGKIYSSPYFSIIVEDFQNSTFKVPFNLFEEKDFRFRIEGWLTENMIESYLSVKNKGFDDINTTFGLGGSFNSIGQKSVNPENTYLAYHQAQRDNSMKNASRHERQDIESAGMSVISASLSGVSNFFSNPLSIFGSAGNIAETVLNATHQVENSREELNAILAQQTDLKNAPNNVSNGNTSFYKIDNSVLNPSSLNSVQTRKYYEIKRMIPRQIVLEKLAWFFHLSGVSYASTPQNINNVLDSNYYFNYIQTAQTTFSNFKIELSSEIKQLIDSTLMTGTTIWHIRDLDQFKGVANYYVNNVEMELL